MNGPAKLATGPMHGLMVVLLVSVTLGGCASAPDRELSKERIPFAALPNGHDPFDTAQVVHHGFREGAIAHFEGVRGHALNILQLSGGGQYGAFGAGFLKAWSKSGRRPQFDIVTGVSTGALLSTHAFLGTPEDDAVLETIFTGVGPSDIFYERGLTSFLSGADAYYDTEPLQRLLDKHITAEVLERVAVAYDQGRRLYVGTTNLDYLQTWVWNMGAIAKQGDAEALDMYKKVLRASAAPPIAFPPVEIRGHLFVDGGVRQNLVVIGLAGEDLPKPPRYGPGNIFVIHNGQESATPTALPKDALKMAGPVIDALLTTSMDTLLIRSYFAAKARGYNWHLVAIPGDVDVGHNALAFDPAQMQTAFDTGFALALQPEPWRPQPQVVKDIPPWALKYIERRD